MAKVGGDRGAYPPTEFSQKYAPVLAPKGKLVSPSDVFGEGGAFGPDVEEKTRQAFKVTMKKLDKLNAASEIHKEDLVRERIDQVHSELVLLFPKKSIFIYFWIFRSSSAFQTQCRKTCRSC